MHDRDGREVAASIRKVAQAEHTAVAMRHVCRAFAQRMRAIGVVQYVLSDLGHGEPAYATDLTAEQVGELQVTLGEGPVVDTLIEERPTLAPDLADDGGRWPVLAPAAVDAGLCAAFAFPIEMGSITVGVLEFYRSWPGELSEDEYHDALLYSDAAMTLLLKHVGDAPGDQEYDLFAGGFSTRWDVVHQATGWSPCSCAVG